ncbi:MAG: lecithin retinol acyltransferase family protein [Vibrio sp.]
MKSLAQLAYMPFYNLAESFLDNVVFDKVNEPAIGSVLYCDLLLGYAEHSGIYVGNGNIVHLDGDGLIELVDGEEFISNTTAMSIYVSCQGTKPVGSQVVGERAMEQVGICREYNFLLDNCHQFSTGCLTGNFENINSFLWMLKDTSNKVLNSNNWRVWDL